MPNIHKNFPLKTLNTFGLEASAAAFAIFNSVNELKDLLKSEEIKTYPLLLLGGGSNILLLDHDLQRTVLKNEIKGINKEEETQETVVIKAGSGEIWHELVMYCVKNNLGGIENLSLIPGTVGAAPMQNIGAYGVEIKDVFHSLEALNLETLEVEEFFAKDCNFGYRESIFKQEKKDKYCILSVSFVLQKTPKINSSYGAISTVLKEKNIETPTIKDISDAVISIRQSKLPDPKEIGNSGSFFKNPELPQEEFLKLQSKHPNIPFYPITESITKVPAGWLIEQAGFKGKKIGNIGVHKNQALVLVNYGGGQGQQIANLAAEIKATVKQKFDIVLSTEVNFIGSK